MKCFVFLALTLLMVINGINGVPTPPKEAPRKEEIPVEASANIERTAEDDSDMLMEPDEFHDTSIIPAVLYSHHTTHASDSGFHPIVNPEYTTLSYSSSVEPAAQSREAADAPASEAQNYFQSYFRNTVPPLGHSRPYFSAGHHRGESTSSSRFGSLRSAGNFDQSILGSGDFGVIRGGTFYGENDPPFRDNGGDFYNFFNKNGHQRPHAATYVQRYTYPEEQFANFRDFADINSPSDSAYSQFVVVYANKNSTESHPNPKNIFEQLELLDKEEKKNKGLSKHKAKLATTKLEKKYRKKVSPKEAELLEPLLALS
ncbi:uncharacterized protein DMENIID0001_093020 [Sergentomyia squamirostris]